MRIPRHTRQRLFPFVGRGGVSRNLMRAIDVAVDVIPAHRGLNGASNDQSPGRPELHVGPQPSDAWKWKSARYNPLRHLNAHTLTLWLDLFENGYIRQSALLWEQMLSRDDVLSVDSGKRLDDLASKAAQKQIVVDEGSGAEGEKHRAALDYFYSNLTTSNAIDLDDHGGFRKLIRQMGTGIFHRYAVHEITWRDEEDGLTADFKFVPLYFFENVRGALRYTGPWNSIGMPITPNDAQAGQAITTPTVEGEWLISRDEGLMFALSVLYLYKSVALKDWFGLSQRFGSPTVHGEIDAAYGSKEWNDFKAALKSMANDSVIVTTKSQNNDNANITLIMPVTGGEIPASGIIERTDRRMSAIVLGSDLRTISTSVPDQIGASVQQGEAQIIAERDCEFITETLRQGVDKYVIETLFGEGVKPLAHILITPKALPKSANDVAVDTFIVSGGGEMMVGDVAERYDRKVENPQDIFAFAPPPVEPGQEKKGSNSVAEDLETLFAASVERDLEPLRERMLAIQNAANESDAMALIESLGHDFPHITGAVLNNDTATKTAALAAAEAIRRMKGGEASNDFHPDQQRDSSGKWAVGGGGATVKKVAAIRGESYRPATDEDKKRLGIAPAYHSVHVTDDPKAEVLWHGKATTPQGATVGKVGYSKAYHDARAGDKWSRIEALHGDYKGLQKRINADISSNGPDAQKALTLKLINHTGLRNGGEEGGGRVKAYGASSLRSEHAKVEGDRVHLDFIGKEGIRQRHSFTSPELARHISNRQAAGKETLFDHDAGGTLKYLGKISGDKYKVHDLRTYHGTALADAAQRKIYERGESPAPGDEKGMKVHKLRVASIVSRELGNNPTMSLKNYIHPGVFQ